MYLFRVLIPLNRVISIEFQEQPLKLHKEDISISQNKDVTLEDFIHDIEWEKSEIKDYYLNNIEKIKKEKHLVIPNSNEILFKDRAIMRIMRINREKYDSKIKQFFLNV